VVTPDPTAITYTGATTANNGSPITLSGTLTTNGTALSGETVTLTLGSGGTAQTCSATTNASGSASCVIASVSQTVGSVPVTASFAGNTYYLASTTSSNVTVSPPPPVPTTLKVNAATGEYNVATAVSGVLTNSTTAAPISGESVTFKLNGSQTCSGITNSTGTASCYITPGETPGTYPLTGTFAGDTTVSPNLLSSSGSSTFVVTPDPTAIVYTGATTAVNGEPATLSGTLTVFGNPLAAQTVTFTLGTGKTVQTCSGTTNASGSATCIIASVTQSNGSVPVTTSFAGTAYYLPSSASSTLIVGVATKLKVNAATGPYGQPTTVSALLTNLYTSAAIAGESVTLTLNGKETCTAITNSTGTASCTITPSEPAGSYPLTGTFAGDTSKSPVLFASSGSNTFVVTLAETALTYTGTTDVVNGQPATLSAVLTTYGNPLPGETVTLTLGSGSTAQSCSGTTNSAGAVSCIIASVKQTATMCMGSVPISASFAGNSYYEAASASSTAALATPPSTTMSCPGGTDNLCIAAQGANEAVTVAPGQDIEAGYDFTIPGSSQPTEVEVFNGYELLSVSCASGSTPSQHTVVVTMPDATYTAPFVSSQGWVPSGNESLAASYEGSYAMPNLCGGGTMDVGQPGQMLFAAQVMSNGSQTINFRSHYNNASLSLAGSFSSTASVAPTSV
jgi:hypothetical protein